jgi:subtilisin family serine protease
LTNSLTDFSEGGNMKRMTRLLIVFVLLLGSFPTLAATASDSNVGINIVLKGPVTDRILKDLSAYGQVRDVLYQINAVMLYGKASNLSAIRALRYVRAADQDAEASARPIDTVEAENFVDGINTWNLDAINVTDFGEGRTIGYTGEGVYVAVLDTGLVQNWRQFFPEERIAEEYAVAFGGGGVSGNHISEQPDKWEHDTHSHGTHVTSTIIGYDFFGTPVNGVAPLATIIPVKILNQNGSGWWSVIAYGIVYVADLKAGPLSDHPVVINMSLSGSQPNAVLEAAVNYAISKGVIVVAAAANTGETGMGYPGAYPQVISAAAAGWDEQFTTPTWWFALDVPNPTNPDDFFIATFSAREKPGQDLDVAAPGVFVVGPFQASHGHASYFYLSGTSMATPHVAGTAALMAEKDPALTQEQAESILENTALPLPARCSNVIDPNSGNLVEVCWGANATGQGLIQADAAVSATP